MALQVPFEAVGISDFLVHPIEKGIEYTVLAVSPDGLRFQAQLPDGTLGWFPTKFVRVLENQPQQYKQQQSHQAQPRQQQQFQNQQISEDELRRREYETAKRDAQEKEGRRQELQNKIKQQPQRAIQQQDEEEILYSVPKVTKLGTYAETRGYLANAPGFGKNLQEYIEESEEAEPEPPPVKTPTATRAPVNETKPGVYKKYEERADGPKYVPTDTSLPEQYKNTPWKCHSCSSVNTPDKGKCHMCGTQRGVHSISVEGIAPKQDWTCSSCKVVNNSQKDNCVMCGNKYRPPAPTAVKGAAKEGGATATNKKKGPVATGTGPKKKQITSKAGAGIELKYAKGVDNCTYKAGSNAKPGHGAGY